MRGENHQRTAGSGGADKEVWAPRAGNCVDLWGKLAACDAGQHLLALLHPAVELGLRHADHLLHLVGEMKRMHDALVPEARLRSHEVERVLKTVVLRTPPMTGPHPADAGPAIRQPRDVTRFHPDAARGQIHGERAYRMKGTVCTHCQQDLCQPLRKSPVFLLVRVPGGTALRPDGFELSLNLNLSRCARETLGVDTADQFIEAIVRA